MLFNSLTFLLFFPIVALTYFLIPQKYRWMLLLLASYYFYMSWKPEFIILIIISTLVDYISGKQIYGSRTRRRKQFFLGLSLSVNLGLLFTFKYFNFFSGALGDFLQAISIPFDPVTVQLILPIGISFYTFQTISYTVDVYRGKIKPEKHLGVFAVFVSFFPQLVAGPIERAKNLIPQFYEKHKPDFNRITIGLGIMLWGMFKKVVVADRMAVLANSVFNNPTSYTGWPIVIAIVAFTIQIYCDFSGYSDIAIGAAQVLGIRLSDNFRRPFMATSMRDLWRRWHITLVEWFKDYIYIPLGGNKVHFFRWAINILVVFFISGLWHGANWTYIFFGVINGLYLIAEYITKRQQQLVANMFSRMHLDWLHIWLRRAAIFSLFAFSLTFFRAPTIKTATQLLMDIQWAGTMDFWRGVMTELSLYIALGAVALWLLVQYIHGKDSVKNFLVHRPVVIRIIIYTILLISTLYFGVFSGNEFIYFQF
jgi:D-alanyl-lipoteichoic acid acyltransferase DltB (MBOAT superfamily)